MILYKITPKDRTVTQHEYDGEYETMKPLLKYEWWDMSRLNDRGDAVMVNDTGLLDGTEEKDGAWYWLHDNGLWQRFVGDALLFGTYGPDNANPTMTLNEVWARIAYVQQKESQS